MLETLATVAARARAAVLARRARKPLRVSAALRRLAAPEQHEAGELAEAQAVVDGRLAEASATLANLGPAERLVLESAAPSAEWTRRMVGYALLTRAMDGDDFAGRALAAHCA